MVSVTTVLQPFMDFSKVPPEMLAAAADRGSEVHSICASIAKNLWVIEVPESCVGYVESFVGWFDSMVEEVILAEERLYDHDLGFHGMPDLIVRLRGDKDLSLVDLKTGKVVQPTWEDKYPPYPPPQKWGVELTMARTKPRSKKGAFKKIRDEDP